MTPEELGHYIRQERKARLLNQTELAARVGCSQRFISELERGKSTAELGLTLRVLDALGIEVGFWPRVDRSGSIEALNDLITQTEEQLQSGQGRKRHRPLASFLEEEEQKARAGI